MLNSTPIQARSAMTWQASQPLIGKLPSPLKANVTAVNFELDDDLKAACAAPWWPLPRRPVAEGNRQGKDATDRDRPQVEALIQDPFFSTSQSARQRSTQIRL